MLSETLYEKLTNDDGRVCEDISDSACREAPKSFSIILLSLFLTKLGDAIASPKTTLAWMVTAVGAPGWALGFLVPLRESGSMLPQLFIGGVIRRLAVRKWVWIAGCVGRGYLGAQSRTGPVDECRSLWQHLQVFADSEIRSNDQASK